MYFPLYTKILSIFSNLKDTYNNGQLNYIYPKVALKNTQKIQKILNKTDDEKQFYWGYSKYIYGCEFTNVYDWLYLKI